MSKRYERRVVEIQDAAGGHLATRIVSARIQHPRRAFPVVQVFLDGTLIHEEDFYRAQVFEAFDLVVGALEEIARAAYPKAAARRALSRYYGEVAQ